MGYNPSACLTSGLQSGVEPSSSYLDRDQWPDGLGTRPASEPLGLPPGLRWPPGFDCNDLDPRHIRDSGLLTVLRHLDKGAEHLC